MRHVSVTSNGRDASFMGAVRGDGCVRDSEVVAFEQAVVSSCGQGWSDRPNLINLPIIFSENVGYVFLSK